MKNLKGITLIALIITIIVMMILVGVTVSAVINGGLIGKSQEASFKTMMSDYRELVDLYMIGKRIDSTINIAEINAGATDREPKINMKDIIGTDVKKGYEDKIAVEMGELYYVPTDPNKSMVKKEIQWCFELGIKVKGYSSYDDYVLGTAPVSDGSYEEVGGIYVNTPDLTGFSKTNTYYVTYDGEGKNEKIGGRIVEEAPEGWYDYKSKIWANVVTKGSGEAYWVWIPRYAYKITYYTDADLQTPSTDNAVTQYGSIDVKFLSRDDIYKENTDSGVVEKSLKELRDEEGYELPEAFKFAEKEAGYWVSKYEVSEAPYFNIDKTPNGKISQIKIISINKSAGGPYNYYLDGELKYTGTDLYTFTNLEPGKMYEIKIEDKNGSTMIRKVTARETANSAEPAAPDLSGFKNTNAYYVTYDENGGSEKIGDKIELDGSGKPTNVPEGWYNYQNKIWANIVTSDQELDDQDKANIKNSSKKIAYWVWIPRYEYKTIDESKNGDYREGDIAYQFVSVNFIGTDKTSPSDGYQIPEAFTCNWGTNEPISGYWVSKYEVSN